MRSRFLVPLVASALLLGALASAGCSKVTKETAPDGVLHPSVSSELYFESTVIFPSELVAGSESQRTASMGGRDEDAPTYTDPLVARYDATNGVLEVLNFAGFQFPGTSESTTGSAYFRVATPLTPGVVTLGTTIDASPRHGLATWQYVNSGSHSWATTDAIGGTLTIHSYDWVHRLLWAEYSFSAVDADGYVLRVTGAMIARVGDYTPPPTGAQPLVEGGAR